MPKLAFSFLLRWGVSVLGLWVAGAILGKDHLYLGGRLSTVLIAGLLLALINMLVKPFLVFLALPAIVVTLGLFMLVVNGLTILIASWLYSPFEVASRRVAIIAGFI